MKHDYKAAIKQMRGFIEDGQNTELDLVCLHALAMMQKLEEPSHGVIQAGVNHAASNGLDGEPWPVYIQNILSAMLEQAELEINQTKGELK